MCVCTYARQHISPSWMRFPPPEAFRSHFAPTARDQSLSPRLWSAKKKRCKSELWSLNIYKIRRANPKLEGQLYQIMAMSIYLMIFRVYDGSSSWGRPIDYVYVLIMRSSLIIWEIMVWWWQTIPNWALLLGHQMISEWMVTDGYWDCCSWLHWFYSRWAP